MIEEVGDGRDHLVIIAGAPAHFDGGAVEDAEQVGALVGGCPGGIGSGGQIGVWGINKKARAAVGQHLATGDDVVAGGIMDAPDDAAVQRHVHNSGATAGVDDVLDGFAGIPRNFIGGGDVARVHGALKLTDIQILGWRQSCVATGQHDDCNVIA